MLTYLEKQRSMKTAFRRWLAICKQLNVTQHEIGIFLAERIRELHDGDHKKRSSVKQARP